MNKPYFTKYIPVEGEIKEGDTFLYKGLSFVDDGAIKGKGRKKAKLFLCSRDVQVGDKVRLINGSNNEYDIKFKDEIGDGLWYKVIGERSPEATWVTEGMEFDDSDIGLMLKHGTEPVPYNNQPIEHISYIMIKCPTCKTFH